MNADLFDHYHAKLDETYQYVEAARNAGLPEYAHYYCASWKCYVIGLQMLNQAERHMQRKGAPDPQDLRKRIQDWINDVYIESWLDDQKEAAT